MKKKNEIQSELHQLIRYVWHPKFRCTTDRVFASLPSDLRDIIESYLYHVQFYLSPIKSMMYVGCEQHVGLDEAFDLMSTLIYATRACGDGDNDDETLPTFVYPMLNRASSCEKKIF